MYVETLKKLITPEQKDIIYIMPEPFKWTELLNINQARLCNIPGRKLTRAELLDSAAKYTEHITGSRLAANTTDRIIASGDQPLWLHPGLWIKDFIASRFAGLSGGTSLHLVVDHDIVDTSMMLPVKNKNGLWSFETIPLEEDKTGLPVELRPLPGNEKVRVFLSNVTESLQDSLCSDLWSLDSVFKMDFNSNFQKISDLVTYLQSMLNKKLGLKILYLPVSQLSQSTSFLEFTASIINDDQTFAHRFNKALDKQIEDRKIKSHQTIRPLSIEEAGDRIELPFWLLQPDGKRRTLFVENTKSYQNLYADDNCLGRMNNGTADKLREILESSNHFIRPKAVTLTLFVRLFLADWFVHGIGGAGYEYITDYLIRRYYRLEKLYFGVTTTTMALPVAESAGVLSESKKDLKKKIRELKYKPEKFFSNSRRQQEPLNSLINEKKEMIRTAEDKNNPSEVRKSAWKSIYRINEKLLSFNKDYLELLNEELELSDKLNASKDVLEYRKFFFGLFPETRLNKILDTKIFT